jgi:DNA-binding NarL/FixJ family response regulator
LHFFRSCPKNTAIAVFPRRLKRSKFAASFLKYTHMKQNLTIGIVEDNDHLRDDIREKLALGENVSVLWEASDGARALQALRQNKVPQVVLMDIAMPGIDGIETTRRAKKLCPDLKIMMLTVMDEEQKLFAALQAGALGYLLKDVKPHSLLQALEEVQEGGVPLSPALTRMVLPILKGEKPVPLSPTALENLTPQEQKVLEYLKLGQAVKEIAGQLFIADNTVRKHLENIYRKLQVHSATEAVAVAQGFKKPKG